MSIFRWFSKPNGQAEILQTSDVNGFAETISVELKRAATQAISAAIEAVEAKYLRSVINESVFPLEGLIFTPQDIRTTQLLDEFIREHEAIRPQFRQFFFREIFQEEYKSRHGATVVVPKAFEPTFHHEPRSFEGQSSEEEFHISLRGRKILFSAVAILGKPTPRRHFLDSQRKDVAISPNFDRRRAAVFKMRIQWFDRAGLHERTAPAPLQIGREPDPRCGNHDIAAVTVDGTYISRRQLNILFWMDQLYAFVPHDASLTCLKNDKKMELGHLYPMDVTGKEVFQFGIAPEASDPFRHQGNTADYPRLEVGLSDKPMDKVTQDGTPKPKAR